MTATLDGVASKRKDKPEPTIEQKVAEELVRRAREQGLSLTGPDGLLKQLTKTVLETALNQELTEHLGHDKHAPAGNEGGNALNGTAQDGADRGHRPGRPAYGAGPSAVSPCTGFSLVAAKKP